MAARADRTVAGARVQAAISSRLEHSTAATEGFFAREGPAIARCAAAMADRFARGGRLLIAADPQSAADAQHNAVEYIHPVIAGCRALPAISLVHALPPGGADNRGVARLIDVLGRSSDILLALGDASSASPVDEALRSGAALGLLTVALLRGATAEGCEADHRFCIDTDDVAIAEEVHLCAYHVLWELVHIVLNHRGIADQPLDGGGSDA